MTNSVTATAVAVSDAVVSPADANVAERLFCTFETLVKRAQTTEVVLAVFRCMDSYAVIPQGALNGYLTEEASADANGKKILPAFSGEIFSKSMLKPLADIRREVTDYMKNAGALIGKAGTYAVPVKRHDEIMQFLESAKNRYFAYLNNTVLQNYDDAVKAHTQQLERVITNPKVLQALIDKIPSKQEIIDRHACFYQVLGAKLPAREDVEKSANQIISMAEAYKEQDLAFIGKITSLFKDYLSNFSDDATADKSEHRLGKKLTAFIKAVDTSLGFEQTIRMVMGGSEFEQLATSAYALLHELKQKLCVNLTQRQRKLYKDVLLSKLKLAAYVLSSAAHIQDYAEGKITVLEENFSLDGQASLQIAEPQAENSSYVVSAAERSLPEDEGTFDAFFEAKASAHAPSVDSETSALHATTALSDFKLELDNDANAVQSATQSVLPADAASAAKPQGEGRSLEQNFTINDAIHALDCLIKGDTNSHLNDQDKADLSSLF